VIANHPSGLTAPGSEATDRERSIAAAEVARLRRQVEDLQAAGAKAPNLFSYSFQWRGSATDCAQHAVLALRDLGVPAAAIDLATPLAPALSLDGMRIVVNCLGSDIIVVAGTAEEKMAATREHIKQYMRGVHSD
jgi:hypothetical protein